MPPCWLHSGYVDVAFRFQKKCLHRASVSLPCENDNGDNRAAAWTSVTSSSPITTVLHQHCPGLLYFLLFCTTIVSPGFRSAGDSTETSRSFILTIDCISCQKDMLVKSWGVVSNPFHQTIPVGFVAILHFTSSWTMLVALTCYSWITSTMNSAAPCAIQSHPVSWLYHIRIIPVSYPYVK